MMTMLLISLAFILVIGAPIAVGLGLSSAAALYFFLDIPLVVVPQTMFKAVDSFSFLAVPFFILAGSFMTRGGVTKRIIDFAMSLVGHIAGGIAQVVVLSGMFFASMSGSSAATTAAIGASMVDEMSKRGYPRSFAAAVVASGGTVGIVIPPSLTMVIYGATANVSIADLFMGGFAPGILMGLSMMAVNYYISRKNKYSGEGAFSLKQVGKSLGDCIWALMVPVIVLGGIYGGVFTPTEAAAVAAMYAVFVGAFIYKELTWAALPKVLLDSAIATSMVMFVVGGANLLGWILTSARVAHKLAADIAVFTDSPVVFLVLVNLLLLALGCVINASAAVVIVTPLLLPVAVSLGIDPTFFGVLMVVNLAIGCITPPVGVDLFIASTISRVSLDEVVVKVLPYLGALLMVLAIVTYFPNIILFLPNFING